MSLNYDEYIDTTDTDKKNKITERLNREAEERKRQNKAIREQYPKYIFYKCNKCHQYKEYHSFTPILDDNGHHKFIQDVKDVNGNKVYVVYPDKCTDVIIKRKK